MKTCRQALVLKKNCAIPNGISLNITKANTVARIIAVTKGTGALLFPFFSCCNIRRPVKCFNPDTQCLEKPHCAADNRKAPGLSFCNAFYFLLFYNNLFPFLTATAILFPKRIITPSMTACPPTAFI